MKNLLLIFLLSIQVAYSQETILGVFPGKDGKIYYSGVVTVDSTSKDELYRRSRQWFANTYKSADDVLQMEDKDAGQIIGKGYFTAIWKVTFYANQEVDVYHTINIQIKDGKYRYEITDFRVHYYSEPSQYSAAYTVDTPMEEWRKSGGKNIDAFFADVNNEVNEIISSLQKAMSTKSDSQW